MLCKFSISIETIYFGIQYKNIHFGRKLCYFVKKQSKSGKNIPNCERTKEIRGLDAILCFFFTEGDLTKNVSIHRGFYFEKFRLNLKMGEYVIQKAATIVDRHFFFNKVHEFGME